MNLENQEVEQFRNPDEYVAWFETVLERIRTLGKSDKNDILLHRGVYKIVHEELFPLRSLLKLKQCEWQESLFKNCIGNQNFDVAVKNNRLRHLEISITDFDDGEAYRMRELMRYGSVSLIAPVVRDDRDRPVQLEDRNDCHNHDEIMSLRIRKIADRIIQKSERIYPEQTGLVVYFDDSSIVIGDRNARLLQDLLSTTSPKWSKRFQSVYIVGPKAEICVESKT